MGTRHPVGAGPGYVIGHRRAARHDRAGGPHIRRRHVAGRSGRCRGRRPVSGLLAHTIIPIVVGYVIAHYFSLLLFQGPQGITLLAGTLDGRTAVSPAVNYGLTTTTGIALVQVIAVVVGHVLAVISTHDRSVALFPQAEAIIGQLPLMVLMVGYTVSGLTLLFAA